MKIEVIQYTKNMGIEEGMKTSRRKKKIDNMAEKIFTWGHWSVLEHSSMTVRITGISRALSHQLVRQRIGVTFTQESQRYFDPLVDEDWYVIPPKIAANRGAKNLFIASRMNEMHEYNRYIAEGMAKEDARFCLPNACKTIVVWTFNMSSLIWFLEQRMSENAQWEIRELANKLYHTVMRIPEWKEYLLHWMIGSRR